MGGRKLTKGWIALIEGNMLGHLLCYAIYNDVNLREAIFGAVFVGVFLYISGLFFSYVPKEQEKPKESMSFLVIQFTTGLFIAIVTKAIFQ